MGKCAIIFDLDGVISDTASVHATAWKAVFDSVLARHVPDQPPFSITEDYKRHVDGKSRIVGIENFLASRGIHLDKGNPGDDDIETVYGVGNSKNRIFNEYLEQDGVRIFDDARRLISDLEANRASLAIASSSKNARSILKKGGLMDSFPVILDGVLAEKNGVSSKPSGDFYQHAASLVGYSPGKCVVIEDAISGVVSAKEAGIGFIVAIARDGDAEKLRDSGANLAVKSLDDLSRSNLCGSSNGLV